MVPYESIDLTGAEALRPGVSFFVSNKTITEVIVEQSLPPLPTSMAPTASSANDWKVGKGNAERISALADGEPAPDDIERAMAALQTTDGHKIWALYQRIGDVLRSYGSPDLSPDFAALLAARLATETIARRSSPVTSEAKPAVAVPPLSSGRP
jgi:hypothetical protein